MHLHNRGIPYLLRRQISHFIFKQPNKTSNILLQNQTFFNCEKSWHANTLQTRIRYSQKTYILCLLSSSKHTNQRKRIGVWRIISIIKNKGRGLYVCYFKNKKRRGVVAPFYTLSFSFFFLFLPATANTTYILYIYLCLFHLFACRSLHKQTQRVFIPFLCFSSFLRFSALCGFIFAFWAFLCLFLFPPQPTHPTPYFTVQNRWLPHSLIFYFFEFQNFLFSKIFCWKKCDMIYLHLVCVYVGTECLHLVVVCV